MIARPQPSADVVVEELEDRVRDIDQRLEDVRERRASCVRWSGRGGPRAGGDLIEPAVAEGLQRTSRQAARTAPADYAELTDRLRRVGRAGRVVLAAARERGRDQALSRPDRQQDQQIRPRAGAGGARRTVSRFTPPSSRPRPRPAARAGPPRRPRCPRARPGRRRRGARRARSRAHRACRSRAQNASLSARFTAFRSTAPPTLRLTETPSRVSPSASSARAGEGVEDQEAVARGSRPSR